SVGGVEFSITSAPLGLQGELGVVVAGSQKRDFPEQTEALVLDVAANQAAVVLQQARLLSEQKRVSTELDERLAQQTAELATAKDELAKRERESWRIIDSIPGPVALLTKTGEVDMANRHLLEYFGATIEETRQWGTNGMVHPEDLSREIEGFTRSIELGTT